MNVRWMIYSVIVFSPQTTFGRDVDRLNTLSSPSRNDTKGQSTIVFCLVFLLKGVFCIWRKHGMNQSSLTHLKKFEITNSYWSVFKCVCKIFCTTSFSWHHQWNLTIYNSYRVIDTCDTVNVGVTGNPSEEVQCASLLLWFHVLICGICLAELSDPFPLVFTFSLWAWQGSSVIFCPS